MRAVTNNVAAHRVAGFLLGIAAALMLALHADARPSPQGNSAAGNASSGRQIFLDQGCNECHGMNAQGLTDAESTSAGPRIAGTQRSIASFISFVRSPISPMAPFGADKISDAQ